MSGFSGFLPVASHRNGVEPTKTRKWSAIRNAVSRDAWIFRVFGCPKPPKWGRAHKYQKIVDFTLNPQLETLFPGMPGFSGFWLSQATEMGGSPQKPENGRFHSKRSIRIAVSKDAWIFWVFGCPKPPKWGGSPQKPENGRFHNKRLIRNAVLRDAWILWVFGCPKPPKWGRAHKSQKIVDFTVNAQLETPFPGMPGFSGFLAVPSHRNGWSPQKPENCRFYSKRSIRNAVSRDAWIFWVFGCPKPPKWGEPTKARKLSISQ